MLSLPPSAKAQGPIRALERNLSKWGVVWDDWATWTDPWGFEFQWQSSPWPDVAHELRVWWRHYSTGRLRERRSELGSGALDRVASRAALLSLKAERDWALLRVILSGGLVTGHRRYVMRMVRHTQCGRGEVDTWQHRLWHCPLFAQERGEVSWGLPGVGPSGLIFHPEGETGGRLRPEVCGAHFPVVSLGPTPVESLGVVVWGFQQSSPDLRYARGAWVAVWGHPPDSLARGPGGEYLAQEDPPWLGRCTGHGGQWGALVGVVPSLRQDRTAAWRDFCTRAPCAVGMAVTATSTDAEKRAWAQQLRWADVMARRALHLDPDLAAARIADQRAIARTTAAHKIHLALLEVARAGWGMNGSAGVSAARGREPVPPEPPLACPAWVLEAPQRPPVHSGRWPHPVRNTSPGNRRIDRHGVGVIHCFARWCAGAQWLVRGGAHTGLWELLALWQGMSRACPDRATSWATFGGPPSTSSSSGF